jgi:hypothetical protein
VSEASFFGDFDVDDALDTEPADPGQVARRLHRYRSLVERLVGRELEPYDELGPNERADLEYVGRAIVSWVANNDRDRADVLGRSIHEFSRQRLGGGPPWDDLDGEARQLAEAIGQLIADWLIRQGAWR